MRKRKKSETSQKRKFVQTDISAAFNKWNETAKLKMIKKKNNIRISSSLIIEIQDSDSESTFKNNDEKSMTPSKRRLPIPFSDDEEDQETVLKTLGFRNEKEIESIFKNNDDESVTPSKRKLPIPFSDDEEDQETAKTLGFRNGKEIEDSGSESTFKNNDEESTTPSKRNLPIPFSDDEKDQETEPKTLGFRNGKEIEDSDSKSTFKTNNEESITPRKRKLPVPFSDDEEDQETAKTLGFRNGKDTESNRSPAQKELTMMKVNNPKLARMNPVASSTPARTSKSEINLTHMDLSDVSMILSKDDTRSECGSVRSMSSETTIIYQKEDLPKKSKVVLKQHIIVPAVQNITQSMGGSDSTTQLIPDRSESKISPSPCKKRASDNERNAKRQKVKKSYKKEDSTVPNNSLVKGNKNNKSLDETNSSGTVKPNKTGASKNLQGGSNDRKIKTTTGNKYQIQSISKQPSTAIAAKSDCAPKNAKSVKQIPTEQSSNKVLNNKSKLSLDGSGKDMERKSESSSSSEKESPSKHEAVKCSTTNSGDKFDIPKEQKTNENDVPSCSHSPPQIAPIKAKCEGKEINTKPLTLITELFQTVYSTRYLKDLIVPDKIKIQSFFKMDVKYQFVCLKLFTRQRKWYNVFKLCNLLNLVIDDSDICKMYDVFKENHMVDTDYMKDDVNNLLIILDPTDLKSICNMFKLKPASPRKDDMIKALLNCCRSQSTLTNLKSTEDLIKEQIKKKMGKCVKLNEDFHDVFYRTYVMGTFTNLAFTNMQDYFNNVLYLRVVFPQYAVEDYIIFYTEDEFIRYARARKCRDELEKLHGNTFEYHKICKTVFMELKALKTVQNLNDDMYKEHPHLMQFTARYVYASTLTSAVKTLVTKYPDDAKIWLEYMIVNEPNLTHRFGDWFYHLTWLHMRYIEPLDYEHAAKLLIKVLRQHREHLSEVQLHHLAQRGQLLKTTKKYKISQVYHDKIAELVPRLIPLAELRQKTIYAIALNDNERGIRRPYLVQDKEGNRKIVTVEQVALEHYLTNGYTGGVHCEGTLVKATFALFFWDIIYMELPASFVSKVQSEPLDMYTKYFYSRRKKEIDKRLEEIESLWSNDEMIKWVNHQYDHHSHELGFCEAGIYIKERQLLETLVSCIGRKVLAKIYERFIGNIRHNQSGMPDLLVWNGDTKKSKFVEVKGENDKLSIGQTLWIKYLQDIGADVEVCHVQPIDSKRKKKVKKPVVNNTSETAGSDKRKKKVKKPVVDNTSETAGSDKRKKKVKKPVVNNTSETAGSDSSD